jgi:hypothetical protein
MGSREMADPQAVLRARRRVAMWRMVGPVVRTRTATASTTLRPAANRGGSLVSCNWAGDALFRRPEIPWTTFRESLRS